MIVLDGLKVVPGSLDLAVTWLKTSGSIDRIRGPQGALRGGALDDAPRPNLERSGQPWMPGEIVELRAMIRRGESPAHIARSLRRGYSEVQRKRRKMGL